MPNLRFTSVLLSSSSRSTLVWNDMASWSHDPCPSYCWQCLSHALGHTTDTLHPTQHHDSFSSPVDRLTQRLTFSASGVAQEFQIWPEHIDRLSLQGRFLRASLGTHPRILPCTTWIDSDQWQRANQMVDHLLAHRWRDKPLSQYLERGRCGATIHFEDPVWGLPCHARLDCVHEDAIFLMRADDDPSPDAPGGAKNALDLHAYMATLGWRRFLGDSAPLRTPVVVITVSGQAPHAVGAVELKEATLEAGQHKFIAAVRAVAQGLRRRQLSQQPEPTSVPRTPTTITNLFRDAKTNPFNIDKTTW